MKSQTKPRAAGILLFLFCLLPFTGLAQNNNDVDCNNSVDTEANDVVRVAPDNMPVYNPKSGASIIIQSPPEDLGYEMPNLLKEEKYQHLFDFRIPTNINGKGISGVILSDPNK